MGGLFSGDMTPWVGWMVFAVVLAIGEIVLPGIFLIWIAIAAAIAGGVAFLIPLPLPAQILVFALACLLATWAGRRWYRDNPVESSDPLLNDRAARLIGRQVTVVEPIVDGEGRVRLDDGTWTAVGPDAPLGARLVVVAAHGATLTVDVAAG
ncbi:NfeD family protein [Sphingobium sufflavum]|uniref:NfeD family protein n=1 Tax=Sphingobium sufflavum TaxID=1129547 RepID=UPI001F3EE344|nr:NfeD family protein [Sphingobium sufflavum]MCE7797826.1 NfeD family protein [Sphingobium sufflavum]